MREGARSIFLLADTIGGTDSSSQNGGRAFNIFERKKEGERKRASVRASTCEIHCMTLLHLRKCPMRQSERPSPHAASLPPSVLSPAAPAFPITANSFALFCLARTRQRRGKIVSLLCTRYKPPPLSKLTTTDYISLFAPLSLRLKLRPLHAYSGRYLYTIPHTTAACALVFSPF